MRFALITASLLALSLPALAPSPASADTEEWGQANRSVVRIAVRLSDGGVASGTGFVISGEYVATAAHVISGATEILVVREGMEGPLQGSPIVQERWQDVAIIRVPGLKLPAATLYAGASDSDQGEDVAVLGFPGESDRYSDRISINPSFQKGSLQRVVNGSYQNGQGVPFSIIEFGPNIGGGYSGSPVIDRCGRVIGVASKSALTLISNAAGNLQRVPTDQPTSRATSSIELNELARRQNLDVSVDTNACVPGENRSATPTPEPEAREKPDYLTWALVGLAALLLIAVILFLVLRRNSPRTPDPVHQPIPSPPSPPVLPTEPVGGRGAGVTQLVGKGVELIGRSSAAYGKKIRITTDDFYDEKVDLYRDQAARGRKLLGEPQISNPHARFNYDREAGSVFVQDLKSTNGTSLNGDVLSGAKRELKTGDLVTFAGLYEFEVKILESGY